MPLTTEDLALPALRARYAAGGTPTALCRELLPALAASHGVFISRPSDEEVLERCRWAVQPMRCHWQRGLGPAAAAAAAAATAQQQAQDTQPRQSRLRTLAAPPGCRKKQSTTRPQMLSGHATFFPPSCPHSQPLMDWLACPPAGF